MRPLDVTPAQQRLHDELVRTMNSIDKARAIDELCLAVRQLAEAGIRHRHPGASDELVRWLLAEHLYGAKVAVRLVGERPS